ncbi:hypothetical protein V6N12_047758 [Hibiscus sabdariffa]|uniref:GRF-type domain-containing protein n=1 Tax=Hibiscus sabdariffa TaxID=183260 RepID=A0ABR2CVN0_9ROSI
MKMELEQEESETTNMIPVCNCGIPAEMRTSWTKANPGRRFFGCPNFGKKTRKCHFFKWFDPEIDDRPRVVILGLLKSKGAMEKARNKERVIWVIFLAFLAYLAFFRV